MCKFGCKDGNYNGWECINGIKTTCTPIPGDGYVVGTEICDDLDLDDNRGCKPDRSGILLGWECDIGSFEEITNCTSICNDGI